MMPLPRRFANPPSPANSRPSGAVCALLLVSLFLFDAAAQEASAGLGIALNGMTEGVFYQGWPLLLEVRANLEQGDAVQLEWPAPVRLTIRNADGPVTWPLQSATSTLEPVTITATSPAVAVWTLSPEATKALLPGDYTIRAEHPATGASRLILVTVSPEPAELTLEQTSLKVRLRSRHEEWTGTRESALRILTEWLETTPGDIAGLTDASDLLADMDRVSEAIELADRALTAFTEQFKDARHPPAGLLRRIRSLEARLPVP